MQNVGENENGQVNSIYDMILMLGGLRAAIFLFAIWLGNNFSLQAFDGISCHVLVDNFISYGWLFYIESAFSNNTAYQKQKEKGGFCGHKPKSSV